MMKMILALTLAMLTLSGCASRQIVSVAPSTGPLSQVAHSAAGKAHIEVVKGDRLFPSGKYPGFTDLSPRQTSASLTKDDVVAAVRDSAVSALQVAGYTVEESLDQYDVRMKVFVELLWVTQGGIGDLDPGTVSQLVNGNLGANAGCAQQSNVSALLAKVAITDESSRVTVRPLSGVGCTPGGPTDKAAAEAAIKQSLDAFRINLVQAIRRFKTANP
jgi:hypothetical protein